MKSLKKASNRAFRVLLISRKPPRAVLMESGDKFCPLSEGRGNCRLWGNRACSSEEGCVQAGLREDEVRILSPDQCLAGSPFGWEVESLRARRKPCPSYCPGHLDLQRLCINTGRGLGSGMRLAELWLSGTFQSLLEMW